MVTLPFAAERRGRQRAWYELAAKRNLLGMCWLPHRRALHHS